jgi:hypothetical protein
VLSYVLYLVARKYRRNEDKYNQIHSRVLSKNLKIKIYRNIILPVVLYGCEAWSLTLREERWLKVFENRVLRKVFGSKRDEVTGEWRKLYNEELNDLSVLLTQYCAGGKIKKNEMWRVWGRGEMCTGFWWGSLREGDHWGDPDVDGRIILRWIFRKWEGVVGTGWSWLRIGTGGGHL